MVKQFFWKTTNFPSNHETYDFLTDFRFYKICIVDPTRVSQDLNDFYFPHKNRSLNFPGWGLVFLTLLDIETSGLLSQGQSTRVWRAESKSIGGAQFEYNGARVRERVLGESRRSVSACWEILSWELCNNWPGTTQIWETLMSTCRNMCGVSRFIQGRVAGDLVETIGWLLWSNILRNNLCTHGCRSNLSCAWPGHCWSNVKIAATSLPARIISGQSGSLSARVTIGKYKLTRPTVHYNVKP